MAPKLVSHSRVRAHGAPHVLFCSRCPPRVPGPSLPAPALLLHMLGPFPSLLLEGRPTPHHEKDWSSQSRGTLSRTAQPPPTVRDGPGSLHPPLGRGRRARTPWGGDHGHTVWRRPRAAWPEPMAPLSAGGRAWPQVGSLGPQLGTLVPQGPQTSTRLLGQ